MKRYVFLRKRYTATAIAAAEGLWNGTVVSGVLVLSAWLIKNFWIF